MMKKVIWSEFASDNLKLIYIFHKNNSNISVAKKIVLINAKYCTRFENTSVEARTWKFKIMYSDKGEVAICLVILVGYGYILPFCIQC